MGYLSSDDDFESLRPRKRSKLSQKMPENASQPTVSTSQVELTTDHAPKDAEPEKENLPALLPAETHAETYAEKPTEMRIDKPVKTIVQTACREQTVSCPICQRNLTPMDPASRETHVNSCLDNPSIPSPAVQQPADAWGDLLYCICGFNMTDWTTSRKEIHLHSCLDAAPSSIFEKSAKCPACHVAWSQMSISARVKHVRKCSQSKNADIKLLVAAMRDSDDFVKPTLKPMPKPPRLGLSTKPTKLDEDMQLAMALSKSIAPRKPSSDGSSVLVAVQAESNARLRLDAQLNTVATKPKQQPKRVDSELWKRSSDCSCAMPHLLVSPLLTQTAAYPASLDRQVYSTLVEEKRRRYLKSIAFLTEEMERETRLLMKECDLVNPASHDEPASQIEARKVLQKTASQEEDEDVALLESLAETE